MRKKLSQEFGFLVPSRCTSATTWNWCPMATHFASGCHPRRSQIMVDRWMAIDPGEVFGSLEGIPHQESAFGLSALWIEASQREAAQSLGYTVVDASTVVATHLNQVMQDHASELLGHDEVQKLVDLLAEISPGSSPNSWCPAPCHSPVCSRSCSRCSRRRFQYVTCARSPRRSPRLPQ
ncbi:MAG: FHIPEP family type III secretion protein [Pseudomonadales bacterium]